MRLFIFLFLIWIPSLFAQEWIKDGDNYAKDGQVTLKRADGSNVNVSLNQRLPARQSLGRTPNIMVVGGGEGSYEFDLAMKMSNGQILTHEANLDVWLEWTQAEFDENFTYDSQSDVEELSASSRTASVTVSGSGSGFAANRNYHEAHGGKESVSCSTQGESGSQSHLGYASINVYSFSPSWAWADCNAYGNGYTARVIGILNTFAEVDFRIFKGARNCSKTMFSEQESSTGPEELTVSPSGSATLSCTYTENGYTGYFTNPVLGHKTYYGFTDEHHFDGRIHYTDDESVKSNPKKIALAGITGAYVDPATGQIYIKRNRTLNAVDQDTFEEIFMASLPSSSDSPKIVYNGIKLTGTLPGEGE